MNDAVFQETLSFARQLSSARSPYALCSALEIEVISDKQMHNDGYLVCEEGCKLIFVSANVQNTHRQKFIVSHEIGHFLLHQGQLYCCANISEGEISSINTSAQEREANRFASEFLLPQAQLASLIPSKSLHFSDISRIANYFDVSMTFSAIRAVQASNTEDEILICYDKQKLKWFASADRTLHFRDIPSNCPVDLSTALPTVDVVGIWDSLYEGTVHQEIFNPYANQRLVLLSGTRINAEEGYYES